MATHTDVACRLGSQGEAARRTLLKEGLLKKVQRVRELSDGYALRFEWSPERIGELAEFVALESECCAFLRFRIEVGPGEGPVWLCLTGSSEAMAFLREGSDLLPRSVQMDRRRFPRSLVPPWTVPKQDRHRLAGGGGGFSPR